MVDSGSSRAFVTTYKLTIWHLCSFFAHFAQVQLFITRPTLRLSRPHILFFSFGLFWLFCCVVRSFQTVPTYESTDDRIHHKTFRLVFVKRNQGPAGRTTRSQGGCGPRSTAKKFKFPACSVQARRSRARDWRWSSSFPLPVARLAVQLLFSPFYPRKSMVTLHCSVLGGIHDRSCAGSHGLRQVVVDEHIGKNPRQCTPHPTSGPPARLHTCM